MARVITQVRSGAVIASVSALSTTFTTIPSTAVIPMDNTIPQITEGQEVLTVTITPSSTTSKVRIRANVPTAYPSAGTFITGALFKNAVANALAAGSFSSGNAVGIMSFHLEFEDSPASVSAQTYRLRLGPHGATAFNINGSGAALFGGVLGVTLVAEEIKG